jgi:hypothetical protein
VPGIKSENVFGQTYGKTSLLSTSGQIQRGYDQPAHQKFNTSMKSEFVNHAHNTYETVAEQVGVQRGPCTYPRVRFKFKAVTVPYLAHSSIPN